MLLKLQVKLITIKSTWHYLKHRNHITASQRVLSCTQNLSFMEAFRRQQAQENSTAGSQLRQLHKVNDINTERLY